MLPALFVWSVLFLVTAKTHSKKPALVSGKKLSKQANKADWLTRQAG
jgi:hypothetical protein